MLSLGKGQLSTYTNRVCTVPSLGSRVRVTAVDQPQIYAGHIGSQLNEPGAARLRVKDFDQKVILCNFVTSNLSLKVPMNHICQNLVTNLRF